MFHDHGVTSTKPIELLGLSDLVAWLETQDKNTRYTYTDNKDCLLARFYRAHGAEDVWVGSLTLLPDGLSSRRELVIPHDVGLVASDKPRTFGAALKRAKFALEILDTVNSELAT
jgi:hypothetical protein